jgi:hypothetical protein
MTSGAGAQRFGGGDPDAHVGAAAADEGDVFGAAYVAGGAERGVAGEHGQAAAGDPGGADDARGIR